MKYIVTSSIQSEENVEKHREIHTENTAEYFMTSMRYDVMFECVVTLVFINICCFSRHMSSKNSIDVSIQLIQRKY